MYACICFAVTEREVREHIVAGADSVDAVGEACGAGTGCGTCHDRIAGLVVDALPEGCPVRSLVGLARAS